MEHKRYDNREYRRARGLGGDGRDEPGLPDTVSHIIDYMLREGLIPACPARSPRDVDLSPRRLATALDAAQP
jgi:hypothetical protein